MKTMSLPTTLRDPKKIERSVRITMRNARRFLEDSKILGENGSVGHATSLAILGYEEAHKAYILTLLHPVYDGLEGEEYRRTLASQLRDHSWKQIYAKEFRLGLEMLLESGAMSEEDRILIGIPSLPELKAGTDLAFSERLDKMKNDGFYSDPFVDPVWDPSDMERKTLETIQKLLETHIKSTERVVKMLPLLKLVPGSTVEEARSKMKQVLATIAQAQTEGTTTVGELAEKLTSQGDIGRMIGAIVKTAPGDERLEKVKQELKRKTRASGDAH